MPIACSNENPVTGTGVYFPASSGCVYAFHGVQGYPSKGEKLQYTYELHERVATEEAFRTVWRQGYLASNQARQDRERPGERIHNSMIFATDAVAGDDAYVFLTVTEPHNVGRIGYHFAFDAYDLVRAGAVIGLSDLGTFFYGRLSEQLGVPDRNDLSCWTADHIEQFQERIRPVQDVWRLDCDRAIAWLDWVHGKRKKNPVSARELRQSAGLINDVGEHNIKYIAKDTGSARRAELLVPDTLAFDNLQGVIFRKNWVEIGDFLDAYGSPGSEPPPALDPLGVHMLPDTGNPARCPQCRDWMNLRPLEVPERYRARSAWHDRMQGPGVDKPATVLVCGSCHAVFGSPEMGWDGSRNPFRAEQYLGQYEDFKYVPYSW
jgi:hypothetical protein